MKSTLRRPWQERDPSDPQLPGFFWRFSVGLYLASLAHGQQALGTRIDIRSYSVQMYSPTETKPPLYLSWRRKLSTGPPMWCSLCMGIGSFRIDSAVKSLGIYDSRGGSTRLLDALLFFLRRRLGGFGS